MKSIQTRYDELIKANLKQAYHAIAALNADLDKAGCKFGPEVIPTFLKPAFISTREEHELRFLVTRLMSMVEKAVHAYFRYPELRPMYAIPKAIRRYIEIDPGYEPNIVITRPDALVAHGVYRFIEFNCDSPAGCCMCVSRSVCMCVCLSHSVCVSLSVCLSVCVALSL